MRKTMLIAVVLALAICVTPVWSQGRPGPGGPGRHMSGGVMAVPLPPPAAAIDGLTESLELTTNQTASLTEVLTASDETIQPLLKTAEEAAKALRDAVFAPEYDAAAVEELMNAALAAQTSVVTACINAWSQIREILTADQFAKLQECKGSCGAPTSGTSTSESGSGVKASSAKHR